MTQDQPDAPKDLIALVADGTMARVITALLEERRDSLGIRSLTYDVLAHREKDPGVRGAWQDYLANRLGRYRYALLLFDRHGCGRDAAARAVAERVQTELAAGGWGERARAICIDPELEAWVWSASPAVYDALGCSRTDAVAVLREYERDPATGKPRQPKRAMRAVLKHAGRRFTPRIHEKIARSVSLNDCRDQAFLELVDFLQTHFPAEPAR